MVIWKLTDDCFYSMAGWSQKVVHAPAKWRESSIAMEPNFENSLKERKTEPSGILADPSTVW